MNNEYKIIDKYLKDSLKKIISDRVDEEIEKKVDEFKMQLVDRKNQYISEIMKGIQILYKQNFVENSMNYKIIFENITRIEGVKQ